jgi:diguanylate cyclase (GGDEF)-like protein/PAS domain S-box-containing protein
MIAEQGKALAHHRKIFERSSEVAKIGVWECDLDGETLAWTDGVYDMFELPRGSAITRPQTLQYYEPDSASEMMRLRAEAIRNRTGFKMEARIITTTGKRRWMRLTATVESENGRAVRIFGMKQDITEEKALADRTLYLAECDVLTGLANRSRFQAALSDIAASGEATLILVDLDGFKQINDTFGHAMGDECLKHMAARLRDVCLDADLVSRVGGDEFAVLTRSCLGRAEIEALAERIVDRMRQPVCWGNQSFQLGASLGIASFENEAELDPDELFSRADMALYAAKGAGKNRFRVFEPVMKLASDLRVATVKNISQALDAGQLDLHYQPKITLADGTLAGFEALLRWRLQDDRYLAASAFSAAFEDPELSRRIGRFVVQRSLMQARQWCEQGAAFGHVAINLCPRQLQDPRFTDDLLQQISAHGLKPSMFEIEITEGVLLTDETGPAYRQMRHLREMGLRVAIDDFGTGYASLIHLRDFPVDTIKIDKTFVQRFLHAPADASILEAILHLGLQLGKSVVAEGVETKEQYERLSEMGCTSAQGYFISKAIPPKDAASFFAASSRFGRVA